MLGASPGAASNLGLGVEDFGGNTVIVTRYPALLGRRHAAEILKRVVDHLMSKERLPTREQLLSDLMSLMACHAAVRSGDPLTAEEIAALVEMRHLSERHAPLPARPADGAVVHAARAGSAVSADLTGID